MTEPISDDRCKVCGEFHYYPPLHEPQPDDCPMCELDAANQEIERLRGIIARNHRQDDGDGCVSCRSLWPCDTALALEPGDG